MIAIAAAKEHMGKRWKDLNQPVSTYDPQKYQVKNVGSDNKELKKPKAMLPKTAEKEELPI